MPVSLSSLKLTLYAGPAVVLSILTFALVVYIPGFYATEAGLSLGSVGIAFSLARGWDAVVDPVIGHFSDSTRSRWGRRKPWIALATPFVMIFTYFLMSPGPTASLAYLLGTIMLFYVSWTAMQIPYISFGADLSRDYIERSRIVGFRETGTLVGIVLVTAIPILYFHDKAPTIREILGVFMTVCIVVLPIAVACVLIFVPKEPQSRLPTPGLRASLRIVRANGPFKRVVSATGLLWLGLHIYNAGILLVIEFYIGLQTAFFLKLVLIQFVTGTIMMPIFVRLANVLGKHVLLGISAIGVSVAVPALSFVPAGSESWAMVAFCALGITISPIWVLPTALVADAADYGMLGGGGDQSGIYMALYNLGVKLALAASVGIALPLMQLFGFDPALITPSGLKALAGVALWLPLLFWLPAAWLLFSHPIDARRHRVLRRWIDRREARASMLGSVEEPSATADGLVLV